MYSKVYSFGLKGIEGFPIEVETDVSNGLPHFEIVGLAGVISSGTSEIAELIYGKRAMNSEKKGMATAGFVIGIITDVIGVVTLVLGIAMTVLGLM